MHITTAKDWQAARDRGRYEVPSLATEGFIHCSTPAQVVATANRFFAGRRDLVLLAIDPSRLGSEVRFENLEGGDEPFPHVYGAIELEAVFAAHPWRPAPSGRFERPDWLPT